MMTAQKIPAGYKQTEIGVIPADWELFPFGKIASLRKQKYDSKKEGSNDFCVELEHIGQGTGTIIGHTETTKSSSIKNVFQKDDVLFGRLRAYLKKYWKATRTGVSSSEIWSLVADSKYTIPEYIFQIVQTDRFIKASAESYGTHMPRTDWNVIKYLLIPLPSTISEQSAIATMLSNTDVLIVKLRKLIEKKKNIKQGAMQQLLTGKKRLPGFTGRWGVKKVGEVLKVKHGKSQRGIIDENGLYPILGTSGEIGRSNNFLYDKPSVLIGRKGTIDVPQYMETPFWTIDTLFFTEISDNANPKFIFYKFNLIDWYSYNEASGVPSLNASIIEKIEMSFPSTVKEQTSIAQILSDMDAEIEKLESQLTKYKNIKQGMMQQLLGTSLNLGH
jgi:type I restriction enzyme S subunit